MRHPIDFDGINAVALRSARQLVEELLPGGKFQGDEYVVRNPLRNDQHPGSFKINWKTGEWGDFAIGKSGGDLISLVAYLRRISQVDAVSELATMLGVSPSGWDQHPNGSGIERGQNLLLGTLDSALAETINDAEIAAGEADCTAARNDELDRTTEIERLAALEPIDYEVVRIDAAKRLKVRAPFLDREVARKRREFGLAADDGDSGQGRAVKIPGVLPWPDQVEGDHLAEALRATIRKYAVLPDAAADAIALWIVLSWAVDNFSIAPRLAVTSPTKGCGKTTVLRLLNKLTRRALKSGCITTAALFRAIEQLKPTLILDENEKYLEAGSDLHAILNEGHCRGATVLRVLGENQELRCFDIFGLVAFARNGRIPDDLEQRSIVIEMQRRLPGESLAELRDDRSEQLDDLARMCCRWADDFADVIRNHDPDMGGLINRVADNWRPLFTIADAIGSDWPDRIRQACADLMPSSENADSTDTMLLADIKAIFDDNGADRLSSEQISEALATMEGHPWAEFGKAGKPITKNKLAYRLDRFGIRSATKRIGDRTAKGYYRHQFEEAWSRYLTLDPPSEPSQRHNSDETGTSSAFQNVTQNVTQAVVTTEVGVTFQKSDVTFQKCQKAAPNGHCDDVTFQKGPADVCAHCQQPETPAHPLLEVGIDGYCVRLHRSCMGGYAPVLNNGGNSR